MQVSVETGDGLTRRVRVDLPAEEIEQEIEKRLQTYARSARLPGFRPGKVPLRMLRQRYGESVRIEVFGERVEATLPQAVTEADLRPAGQPAIEPDLDAAAGRYSYTAEFEVLPEIALASLEQHSVTRPLVEITDADVDTTIERLREQRKQWHAAERPAATGDRLTVDFEGRIDAEPFDGGKAEGAKIEIGAGHFIPGFEEQLVGTAPGEERSVEVTFPEDYPKSELAGKPAVFSVVVKDIEAPALPDVDAEFIREFGVDDGDIERFRADVRANLEREMAQRVKAKIKGQVMDVLLEANPLTIPKALVADEIESLRQQMTQNLGGSEVKLPDELFAENAERRVALGLIMGEIIKANQVTPDADRVRAAVEEMAATYDDPQAVTDYYYGDRARLASVESMVMEDQVVDLLLDQLQVNDENTSFADLTAQQ